MSYQEYRTERSPAHVTGRCLRCEEFAQPRCYSPAGWKEFGISGVCEVCFDEMFADPEDKGNDSSSDSTAS